eukprot:1043348_1
MALDLLKKQKENETKSFQNEIAILKRENSELNEECKETKLELMRVKEDLEANKNRLDPANYLQWSESEVVDWIISLEEGKYAAYEEHLRLVFASESVNGVALSEISKSDLKDWGIKHFLHRSNLYKAIQELVSAEEAAQTDEFEGQTA